MKILTVRRGVEGYLVSLDTLDADTQFVREERMEAELAGQDDPTVKTWTLRAELFCEPDSEELVVDPFHTEDFKPMTVGAEFALNGYYGFYREAKKDKTRWVFLVHKRWVKVQ
jgi:hypothetical protein